MTKLLVGLSRGKPVGYLVFFLVVTVIAALLLIGRSTRRIATNAGVDVLNRHKEANGRSLRAPMRTELLAAFAVSGVAVLVGTPMAAYATAEKGDGGGGGGCGGGGGGGGCGGCGS